MSETKKPLSFSLCPLNIAYVKAQVAAGKLTRSRYSVSEWGDDLITHLRTKAEAKTELVVKKKKAKFVSADVEGLNVEAWKKWIDYRKGAKIKAYTTDLMKKELATLGNHEEQAQIVFDSIKKQYTGLFPLKTNNSAAKEAEHDDTLNSTDWALNMDDVL